MTFIVDVARLCLRICVLLAVVLGLMIWSGHGRAEVPIHMAIGLVFAAALVTLALLGFISRANAPLSLLALVYAPCLVWLGFAQTHLLVGSHAHELIRLAHLLVGLGAMPIGEILSKHILATPGIGKH